MTKNLFGSTSGNLSINLQFFSILFKIHFTLKNFSFFQNPYLTTKCIEINEEDLDTKNQFISTKNLILILLIERFVFQNPMYIDY